MARSINTVTILGNLVRVPELKTTPWGTNQCYMSLALNSAYKNKDSGEWVNKVDYIDVQLIGNLADTFVPQFTQGQPIAVSGKLKTYTQEIEGKKISKMHVVADKVVLLKGADKLDSISHDEPVDVGIPF